MKFIQLKGDLKNHFTLSTRESYLDYINMIKEAKFFQFKINKRKITTDDSNKKKRKIQNGKELIKNEGKLKLRTNFNYLISLFQKYKNKKYIDYKIDFWDNLEEHILLELIDKHQICFHKLIDLFFEKDNNEIPSFNFGFQSKPYYLTKDNELVIFEENLILNLNFKEQKKQFIINHILNNMGKYDENIKIENKNEDITFSLCLWFTNFKLEPLLKDE